MQEEESRERKLDLLNVENQEIGKGAKDRGVYEEIHNSKKYISGPKRVQDGTVPMNILEFQYPL